ncbi:MAG: hypothetical protein NUW37_18415 [Planctomycetes bacterium]|nr:hypothetical protein [Planctomycetota bacterium]
MTIRFTLQAFAAILFATQGAFAQDDVRTKVLDSPFFREFLPEATLSSLYNYATGTAQPDRGTLGGLGVGNGVVFGLQGYKRPFRLLHNLCGPGYDKEDGFFPDVVLGPTQLAEEEGLFRIKGTAVNVTYEKTGAGTLRTITFAQIDSEHLSRAYVPINYIYQLFVVEGVSSAEEAEALAVFDIDPSEPLEPGMRAEVTGRSLSVTRSAFEERGLRGERFYCAAAVFEFESENSPMGVRGRSGVEWAILSMQAVVRSWRELLSGLSVVETPDERWNDFFDATNVLIKVQQSAQGATCPMHRYGGTWTRDITGPVYYLTRAGDYESARAMIDYYYKNALQRGGIANANNASIIFPEVMPEVDFLSRDTFTGRLSAEGPSYIPLQYERYVRFSGDRSILEGREGFLEHALMKQQIDEDGLQPWSGDETFRDILRANLSLGLNYKLEDETLSSNSSLLYLASSIALNDLDPERWRLDDRGSDKTEFQLRFEKVLDGMRFYRSELPLASYVRKDDRSRGKAFEDAGLQLVWPLAREDARIPFAREEYAKLVDALFHEDGTVRTTPRTRPFIPMLRGDLSEGLVTGMNPGYALSSLCSVGDPRAKEAFESIRKFVSPTGELGEAHLASGGSAFHPVYDSRGQTGDLAARYRPWEGGIVADAALQYLSGINHEEDFIVWRPALPNIWEALKIAPLKVFTRDGEAELQVLAYVTESTAQSDARSAGERTQWLELRCMKGVVPVLLEADTSWPSKFIVNEICETGCVTNPTLGVPTTLITRGGSGFHYQLRKSEQVIVLDEGEAIRLYRSASSAPSGSRDDADDGEDF